MLYTLINKLDKAMDFARARAHCDIPCKIYDPATAQIAALTMLRMVDLINEQKDNNDPGAIARLVATKEEHGVKCKEEIRIIWGDYFKAPQIERFPEIHELTHGIMLLASQCKQQADRAKTLQLIEQINRFAEIFWASKEVQTKRRVCPYPPAVEVVYPDL